MINVKKIDPKKFYCVVCDGNAEYEISNGGDLKLFWAREAHDGEITLCKHCFEELKKQINSLA